MESRKQYNPQMHSAEHILNQTMVRMFNCGRSFSNHIEKKKSKCDYHFQRALTDEEIVDIQYKVNNIIQQDMPVVEDFISRDDAEQSYNLSKLPDGAGDSIRIIKIGDYDACPCSGQHITHTKEIGKFKIISTNFENSVLRIRFKLLDE
jgi:Ser-tRNA(Ala) deacylase AlaX